MKSGQVIFFKLKPQIMTSDYSCFGPVNNDSGCFLSRTESLGQLKLAGVVDGQA